MLHSMVSTVELNFLRSVMSSVGKLCSASLRVEPNPGHASLVPAGDGYWKWDSNIFRTLCEISHWASILCRFTKGTGNLVSKRQTVQIVLYHLFLNCLFSDSASLLSSRDEHLGYFLVDAWKWGVVPWSYYSYLREWCQRETAHYSAISNTVKCTRTTCNRVITVSVHWNDAIRAAID